MDQKYTKRFAIAYAVFNQLPDNPIKTRDFSRIIGINVETLKGVISHLARAGLVKTFKGRQSPGIVKNNQAKLEEVFKLFGYKYKDPDAIKDTIQSLLDKRKKTKTFCIICDKRMDHSSFDKTCEECSKSDVQLDEVWRLAKCGHKSKARYFHCEGCMPVLESDDAMDESYSVHI